MTTFITPTPEDAVAHPGAAATGRVGAVRGQVASLGVNGEQRSEVLSAPGRRSGTGSTLRAFLSVAVRRPGTVGAVWPSSAALAGLLASVVPRSGDPVVVEMGPGTGAVSIQIARRLPAGGRHLAVEVDPVMAGGLAQRLPGLEVINADACWMRVLLAARGVYRADVVISGLPWGLFSPAVQQTILGEVLAILPPEGCFTTFAYRHAAGLDSARALLLPM